MVPIRSFPLTFKSQSGRDEIFFPWPTQVLHTVDEESPLWSLSRHDFQSGKYELIVVLDGICGSTSNSFQARKSYHTNELKWGYRFSTMNVTYEDSSYVMDLSNFHHTVPASTPLCSAQDINSLRILYAANHAKQNDNIPSSQSSNERPKRKYEIRKNKKSHDEPFSPGQSESSSDQLFMSPLETHRSHSMEEKRNDHEPKVTRSRRCSLGDMIRLTQGKDNGDACYLGDAKNIYRHRKSVTDTYLGSDIEECEDDYQAIMTVVSQRSIERRTDVRDIFKKRRNSVSRLFFEPKTEFSEDEAQCSYIYSNNVDIE